MSQQLPALHEARELKNGSDCCGNLISKNKNKGEVNSMGLGTFLLRGVIYGGIATGALYYPIYNSGFSAGQVNGYKVGYTVCEQKKNSEIESIVQKSVAGFTGIRDSAKSKIEEITTEGELLKKSGLEGVTDEQIKKLLDEKKEKEKLEAKAGIAR